MISLKDVKGNSYYVDSSESERSLQIKETNGELVGEIGTEVLLTLVKHDEIRLEDPDHVLLLDGGDEQ